MRLKLFALAYNLGNFLRRLALPQTVQHWSLTTLREKLIKNGAKIVHHSRYVTFQMVEVASLLPEPETSICYNVSLRCLRNTTSVSLSFRWINSNRGRAIHEGKRFWSAKIGR